ncbi:MAG: hypothetical protein ABEK59_13065 [Halobacteria archaeon]
MAKEQKTKPTYIKENEYILVTNDVTDFSTVSSERHAGLVLLYDDTLPAYQTASALLNMIKTYPDRNTFPCTEVLDDWN